MRKKRRPSATTYGYHGFVEENTSPLGFPKGSRIKGDLVSFAPARDTIRAGQLVVARDSQGSGHQVCFYHQANQHNIVAVVRLVILPHLTPAQRADVPKYRGVRYL